MGEDALGVGWFAGSIVPCPNKFSAAMNIRVTYRYCDAARFCQYYEVIFANPSGLAPTALETQLGASTHARDITRQMGLGAILFDPTALGLPELSFEESSASDLDWHEFVGAEPTTDAPTDPRPVIEFLAEVAAAPAFTYRTYNAFGLLTR